MSMIIILSILASLVQQTVLLVLFSSLGSRLLLPLRGKCCLCLDLLVSCKPLAGGVHDVYLVSILQQFVRETSKPYWELSQHVAVFRLVMPRVSRRTCVQSAHITYFLSHHVTCCTLCWQLGCIILKFSQKQSFV